MISTNNILNKYIYKIFTVIVVASIACLSASFVSAASVPGLTLTNTSSSVNISVTGADHNATVMFYYPKTSVNNSTSVSYTSIDIGQTDSNGSFIVSVTPNSYGLSGGVSVYVSVDGANSSQIVWPITSSTSQTGSLTFYKPNVTLAVGQSTNIFASNSSNPLALQSNSNPSIVSASAQTSNQSIFVNGLNIGSSTLSICASTDGCGIVNISVVAPTVAISFNQQQAYVVVGQPTQTVGIYGGSSYSLSNSNQNVVSATINGSNLVLQGLAVGQATVSVCAAGYQCGSIVINSLSPGSAVPTQTVIQPPTYSNFNQPPQLSSLAISSNNVSGLFFGVGSTININFGTNETVTNVQVKIAGIQVSASQGSDGLYYVSYRTTGNEIMPLPVIISFTDLSSRIGQSYFWIGNSSTAPTVTIVPVTTATLVTTTNTPVTTTTSNTSSGVNCPTGMVCMPTATSVPSQGLVNTSSSSFTFNNYLYDGMNKVGQSDPDVVALQKRLTIDGLFKGYATGYFGPLTKASVQAYQTKHGLSPLGVVGPATRNLLNQGI